MITVARILLRRVALLVPLMLGIVLFVFLVMRFSDVDPASAFFQGANPTSRQLHDFREQNGLLDPLPVRYVHFVGALLHGDMGTSALTRAPVIDQVTTALPLTLQLTFLGLGVAVVLSLAGGGRRPSTATGSPTRSSAWCRSPESPPPASGWRC